MNAARITEYMSKAGLDVSPSQAEQFNDYLRLLLETNEHTNLTAITDEEEVLAKHFADSALLLTIPEYAHLTEASGFALADIGSGAGFPGVPLKILCPGISLYIAEALDKRINFLDRLCRELGLKDVTLRHGRAEDLGRDPEMRERVDMAVSRAVASMNILSEYCLPFVKPGGCFAAWKAGTVNEGELEGARQAITLLGGGEPVVKKVSLPDRDDARCIVITEKKEPTPDKYPRRAGIPAKRPL
ncbi:MAG: 16S rRNA (guanine(527)-N(7))-methyltransferase RsmG [Lachnospiraceae bacterium]|nr:16S rRNA (guanine(527)-N(7))-methyltransferase RsmG [Lachnospiraceae bacterium]